jgi:ATP-dependent Clp protease ATP-binding subunit ClpB
VKYDKYTIKAQEALASAQQLVMAKSNTVLSPLHLLHVLLDDDNGAVVTILKKIGTDVTRVCSMVDSEIGRLAVGKTDQILPDQAFSQVVLDANNQADKMGDAYVSVEHLLLSLAQIKSNARDILGINSISVKAIEAAIKEVRGGRGLPVTTPRPPTRPWSGLESTWWLWRGRGSSIQ